MRKYYTWRCIGLHLLVMVLVPTFVFAGWWQYHVALGGNDLSWVYTFEWPFFAVYAVYVWWKMIHDRTTMLDRLWAVKARAAADAEGKPLHQIPGWAMDKGLSRDVVRASLEAARLHELGTATRGVPVSTGHEAVGRGGVRHELHLPAALSEVSGSHAPAARQERTTAAPTDAAGAPAAASLDLADGGAPVIDAHVVEDKVIVDEDLDAYNRYLAELSWRDPPKRWRVRRDHHAAGSDGPVAGGPRAAPGTPAALGDGDARRPN